MKYLVGLVVALTIMVPLTLLNKFQVFEIPPMLIGWISCLGYIEARDSYENKH